MPEKNNGPSYEPVTLKFKCNVPDDNPDGGMHEEPCISILPRAHALMIACSMIDGGTPEGHFTFDVEENPWIDGETWSCLQADAADAYRDSFGLATFAGYPNREV